MKKILAAENLSYSINEAKLFQGLSFELHEGNALHVLGSNGSGKTSLLRIISGLTKPTRGIIKKYNTKNICFVGHKNALKQYLTVEDNISLLEVDKHIDLNIFLEKLELNNLLDVMVANLSYGQQKKLALLRVFLNDSDLLVLDEPCVGLDKNSKNILCSFLRDQKEDKKALIFSSHLSLDIDSEFINLDKDTS